MPTLFRFLFVLSTIIIERDHYAHKIVPALARLKLRYWPHEGVNLHTRDIRKALADFAQRGWIRLESRQVLILDVERLGKRAR